jgi:ankyrin repeat protein
MLFEESKKENIINLSSSSVEKDNNNGFEEINQAIISKDLNNLTFLLKSGKNPNSYNDNKETPIFTCIELDSIESLKILLEYGANCNFQKNDGNSPLHIAIIKKNENIINLLLENKANPNLTNKTNYQTPFHLAIIKKLNKNNLIKFKENNADWNIKDKYNKTPFDYSLELNDNNYLLLLDNIFGKIPNDTNINEINANNFKTLTKKISDNNKKYNYNEDNKENNNSYNIIIGDTNANTMSEVYSSRDYNNINSKNKLHSIKKEKVIKENKLNNNDINYINNFTFSKKDNSTLKEDYFIIENEKLDFDSNIKDCINYENKNIMKKILMDTIKKVNRYKTYNKNSNSKDNLENDNSNKSKIINISEQLN